MPVLESTEFTTPRSALRHRPIGDDSKQQERLSPDTSAPTPIVQRASRTRTTTDASVEVDEWERASGNSAGSVAAQPHIHRSNATTGPKTLSKTPTRKQNATHRLPKAKSAMGRNAHPLLYLGIGMLGMLILWIVLMGVVNWFNTTMDDITLTFMDVNGDRKPDMIINVQGSKIVFINDQGTFRPLRADERPQVEQFLQQHGP